MQGTWSEEVSPDCPMPGSYSGPDAAFHCWILCLIASPDSHFLVASHFLLRCLPLNKVRRGLLGKKPLIKSRRRASNS